VDPNLPTCKPSNLPTRRHALRTAAGLALLTLAALVLRCWGLTWSVPDQSRFYLYHPDEAVLLHAVCSVNPLWGDFTPSFYNYGSLTVFLARLGYDLLAPFLGWGPVPRGEPFPGWVGDFGRLLLVGRWLTVLLGTATVPVTYGLGRKLFGARAGWLAAIYVAVAPLPALLGHYLTVDVPSAFFTTLALFLAATALRSGHPPRAVGAVIAAGFIAGLATGTKYNSFPALFALAVPVWSLWRESRPGSRRDALLAAGGALLACAAGYFLATPGALLEPEKFRGDLLYEMGRNREGQGLVFRATPPAALYHLLISLPVGLEWPLYLLSLAGVGWALRKRGPEDWLLLLFLIPFFGLLVFSERKFLRYVAPMVPVLGVFAARVVDEGLSGRLPRLWTAVLAVAGAAALASTVAHLGVLSAPDARDRAAAYLARSALPGEIVALGSDPWFYTSPVHPTAGCVKVALGYGGPPVWDREARRGSGPVLYRLERYTLLAPRSFPVPEGPLPVAALEKHRPKYVVLTDYEYEDPERIRRADPSFRHGILDLLDALGSRYHLEKEFRPRPSILGFTWWREGIPPHDWRYYMLTVRIYRRNE
jgi:4-amino-4-deoxy-L-arabinose transferase-like glycosyltransferase